MFGSVSRAVTVFAGLATTFLGIVVAKRHHPNEISDLSELKTQVDENLRLNVDAQTQFYWRDDDPKTNPAFNQTTHRWSARNSPQFDLVVHVMREVDVGAVVRFANGLDRPFLAITGGHGTSRNLGFVRGGIGIWMQSLNSIIIDDVKAKKGSMTAVTVQGGTMVGDLRRALLEKGYMTVLPVCDCIGYISPLLGGGHGLLQGEEGVVADQLLAATIVLPSGEIKTVCERNITSTETDMKTSPTCEYDDDLLWALRGAGHNFGIVTSARIKVERLVPQTKLWTVGTFVYNGGPIESVLTVVNPWLDDPARPAQLSVYVLIGPNVNQTLPPITVIVYWHGDGMPATYGAALTALGPVTGGFRDNVSDLELSATTQSNMNGSSCAKGMVRLISGTAVTRAWPIPQVRAAYDYFAAMGPDFSNSIILLEGYADKRVRAIPDLDSAFPARDTVGIFAPFLTYPANVSKAVHALADVHMHMFRQYIAKTAPEGKYNAYVNYARGDETPEMLYGYNKEKQRRLGRLKEKYDPKDRSSYFGRIPFADEEGLWNATLLPPHDPVDGTLEDWGGVTHG